MKEDFNSEDTSSMSSNDVANLFNGIVDFDGLFLAKGIGPGCVNGSGDNRCPRNNLW